MNVNGHSLFQYFTSGSLPPHLGIECVDDTRDPRGLEHDLRSITLGFVREFRTQVVDVDVLQLVISDPVPGVVNKKAHFEFRI